MQVAPAGIFGCRGGGSPQTPVFNLGRWALGVFHSSPPIVTPTDGQSPPDNRSLLTDNSRATRASPRPHLSARADENKCPIELARHPLPIAKTRDKGRVPDGPHGVLAETHPGR